MWFCQKCHCGEQIVNNYATITSETIYDTYSTQDNWRVYRYRMTEKKHYSIGEMSKITGITISSLRFYDRKKVLQPEIRDPHTKYRYYSEKQIIIGLMIYEYQQVGFTLQDIKKVLDDFNTESMTMHSLNFITKTEEEIKLKQKHIQRVKFTYQQTVSAIKSLSTQPSTDQVVFSKYAKRTVLFTRMQSKLFSETLYLDRYSELLQLRDKLGLTIDGPLTAIFHENYMDRFSPILGDLELFFPISDQNRTDANIREQDEMLTASIVFCGNYSSLFSAYASLIRLISQRNYRISGPPMEEYLIELVQTSKPEEYITRIHFPVDPDEAQIA